MTTTTIATLRAGQELEGVFACTRKDRLMSRGGTPYLAVELRDRTGAVQGRAFRDADVLAGRFERGDLVRVAGRVERFREELQVDLRAIGRAPDGEADPAAFLPAAYRDLDELDGFLEACPLHPRLDCDLLVAAALVHDIGKTREFTYGAEIGITDAGRLLGHVELGLALCAIAPRRSTRSTTPASSRSHTACSAITAPTRRPTGASARRRRWRCIASTRSTPRSRRRSSTGSAPRSSF